MKSERWGRRGANRGGPVGHREDFAFRLSKIGSHWRATYVSTLAPMLRIDLWAGGKSSGKRR